MHQLFLLMPQKNTVNDLEISDACAETRPVDKLYIINCQNMIITWTLNSWLRIIDNGCSYLMQNHMRSKMVLRKNSSDKDSQIMGHFVPGVVCFLKVRKLQRFWRSGFSYTHQWLGPQKLVSKQQSIFN